VILRLADVDVDLVRRQKRVLGLTTSVVIPALDEEHRVGDVVAALQPSTAPDGDGIALIDELVVVDGGSTDRTVARARDAGARVVLQPGPVPGKGAALQHGVRITGGDLIAFVDADVHDPHAGLAIGPLAALLLDPALRLVKAAYERPFGPGTTRGGGRVTELTVRPLLALLWPELADVQQPLAGEYAADRALLEGFPFEAGYGVELGLLLDTYRAFGRAVIGEVDLGSRSHDHQPLDALGVMAAELLLVAFARSAQDVGPLPPSELRTVDLPVLARDEDGRFRTGATRRARTVARTVLPPVDATLSGGPRRR
jgi:glucosyl-3-phosphoglycerate synthase